MGGEGKLLRPGQGYLIPKYSFNVLHQKHNRGTGIGKGVNVYNVSETAQFVFLFFSCAWMLDNLLWRTCLKQISFMKFLYATELGIENF